MTYMGTQNLILVPKLLQNREFPASFYPYVKNFLIKKILQYWQAKTQSWVSPIPSQVHFPYCHSESGTINGKHRKTFNGNFYDTHL